MKPITTERTNFVFKLAGGTRENDLPVCRTTHAGIAVIESIWQPTDEEREAIANGAGIELTVWGTGTPPVALGVASAEAVPPCIFCGGWLGEDHHGRGWCVPEDAEPITGG